MQGLARRASRVSYYTISGTPGYLKLANMIRKPRVAIIGAGLAGLRCADILTQNGAQVTILEARDRIGGRIHQQMIGKYVVDFGPNWIHGTNRNPIHTIAEATNTCTWDWDGSQMMFNRDGKQVDDTTATKVNEWVWSTILDSFTYSHQNKATIHPDSSLLDYFQERLKEVDFTAAEKALCLEACKVWGSYVGDSVSRQSLKFVSLEECVDGTNLLVASTYKRILDYVSKPALQHAQILLNEPIARIHAKPRCSIREPHTIAISTATGNHYTFDEVVVTCPLGWLKKNKSAFAPELPLRLQNAIDNISYGRLEKVYVTFPEAFWQQTSPPTPPSVQWLDPRYDTPHRPAPSPADHTNNSSNPIEWHQECVSLADLPPNHGHPTLLFYTYGECSTHIVTTLKDMPPSSQAYYDFLTEFTHPFYSRLPGYSPSDPRCRPLAVLATQWQNDPYAGNGSYCNFQVGIERAEEDIEALRAGMGQERGVWFAGEHTSPFAVLGTTNGAYWSGERAAGQICDLYRLGRKGLGSEIVSASTSADVAAAAWDGKKVQVQSRL